MGLGDGRGDDAFRFPPALLADQDGAGGAVDGDSRGRLAGGGSGREASTVEMLKRPIKRALATRRTRGAILRAVRIFERHFSPYSLLTFLYRTVIALHFFAGVREGFQIYSANEARE